MKRALLIILIMLFSVMLIADEQISAEDMLKELSYLSVPVEHEYISVHPGLIISRSHESFMTVNINIPFATPYYVQGEIGAGIDKYGEGGLSLFGLGLGSYGDFSVEEDLFYLIGVSYRSLQSFHYSTSILQAEFKVEKNIQKVYLGIGFAIGIQDYVVSDSDIYLSADERIYSPSVKVSIRSPFGNAQVSGMPNAITAGFSWTLNLDK